MTKASLTRAITDARIAIEAVPVDTCALSTERTKCLQILQAATRKLTHARTRVKCNDLGAAQRILSDIYTLVNRANEAIGIC